MCCCCCCCCLFGGAVSVGGAGALRGSHRRGLGRGKAGSLRDVQCARLPSALSAPHRTASSVQLRVCLVSAALLVVFPSKRGVEASRPGWRHNARAVCRSRSCLRRLVSVPHSCVSRVSCSWRGQRCRARAERSSNSNIRKSLRNLKGGGGGGAKRFLPDSAVPPHVSPTGGLGSCVVCRGSAVCVVPRTGAAAITSHARLLFETRRSALEQGSRECCCRAFESVDAASPPAAWGGASARVSAGSLARFATRSLSPRPCATSFYAVPPPPKFRRRPSILHSSFGF